MRMQVERASNKAGPAESLRKVWRTSRQSSSAGSAVMPGARAFAIALLSTAVAGWPGTASAADETTFRVSVGTGGVQGNADSSRPSVSADGRYVAFYSDADTLVASDTNSVRDVFVRDRVAETTVRVSVNSAGVPGNDKSDRPSISASGRFVAFTSDADNLVSNDFNGVRDIFVHDRDTDGDGVFDETGAIATVRVSVSSGGAEGNDRSNIPVISADGRFVAFRSRATNLIAGGTSNLDHVYVHDRDPDGNGTFDEGNGTTTLMSISSGGVHGNSTSDRPAISDDGRIVAFFSDADNLVAGDTPTFDPDLCPLCTGFRDVFVRDRDPDGNGTYDEGNGVTSRVSVSSGNTPGNGPSTRPSLSGDGRYVQFKSFADNLVSGDTNDADDVFVHDRQTGDTVRISVNSDGDETLPDGPDSGRASLSADGRYVAFFSPADSLVSGDTNQVNDVFVRDRQSGTTVRVSVSSAGVQGNGKSNRPSISADGRFVAFYSDAYNLVAGDDPTFDPTLCPDCTGVRDIFVHDRDTDIDGIFDEPGAIATTRVSVSSLAVPANGLCTRPSISTDGRYVAFRSIADNLVTGDTNGFDDVFVHDRQTGSTVRVSVHSSGAQGLDGDSEFPSISGDGRFVAFRSKASTLVDGDDPTFDDILCPSCTGVADVFVHDRDPDANGTYDEGNGTTVRVSVSSLGVAADGTNDRPWMAADGRYVGFISEATNLVAGDGNLHTDVFVHDLQTGDTVRVSLSTAGVEGNFGSDRVTLSADGRFVGLRSKADNLVAGDEPSFDRDTCPACIGTRDVFIRDRDPDEDGVYDEGNGVTTRFSETSGGQGGDRDSGGPKLSADGSVLAFVGGATNLVAGDTNFGDDVFVAPLATGTIERISVSSAGGEALTPIEVSPDSDDASISADGRFVSFRSFAVNLVPRDSNSAADIFLHDRDPDENGTFDEPGSILTERVSIDQNGAQVAGASGGSKISADASTIAFYSDADDLVDNDTNLARDAFTHGVSLTGCGNGVCDADEDSCTCPSDCGAPPSAEDAGATCADGLDNDCDGDADCADADCQPCPCLPPTVAAEGPRYAAVTPALGPPSVAIRVEGVDPDVAGVAGYLDAGGTLRSFITALPPGPGGWETAHAHGSDQTCFEMPAGMTYRFQTDCDPSNPGTSLSDPVLATLWDGGDADNSGSVDISDAVRGVDGFRARFHIEIDSCTSDQDCDCSGPGLNRCRAPHFKCDPGPGLCLWITIENVDNLGENSCGPNGIITIRDIVETLNFFQGFRDICNPGCP